MSDYVIHPWLRAVLTFLWSYISDHKFLLGVAIPTALFVWLVRRRNQNATVSPSLPFLLGSATFDLTRRDRVLAWRLYVQLVTRKAALPFDKEHDLVVDVFDSLYELFRAARDLLADLPPSYYRKESGVAALVIRVLNDGVRPLLTRWQAEYRRWWDGAVAAPENRARSPQDIQSSYPHYKDLFAAISTTNTELSKFADELASIAVGRRQKASEPAKAKPLAPSPSAPGGAIPGAGLVPPASRAG